MKLIDSLRITDRRACFEEDHMVRYICGAPARAKQKKCAAHARSNLRSLRCGPLRPAAARRSVPYAELAGNRRSRRPAPGLSTASVDGKIDVLALAVACLHFVELVSLALDLTDTLVAQGHDTVHALLAAHGRLAETAAGATGAEGAEGAEGAADAADAAACATALSCLLPQSSG